MGLVAALKIRTELAISSQLSHLKQVFAVSPVALESSYAVATDIAYLIKSLSIVLLG